MKTTTERRDGVSIITIDPGDTVLCDWCNGDWTDRPESGGFMFSSYATCPECAPGMEARAAKARELQHIKARCPPGMPFGEWIRKTQR